MRGFPPSQCISISHHVDVAQAVGCLLDAPSPAHRIYKVVDDEAPDLATLFASVGAPPADGSDSEGARAFACLSMAVGFARTLASGPNTLVSQTLSAAGA